MSGIAVPTALSRAVAWACCLLAAPVLGGCATTLPPARPVSAACQESAQASVTVVTATATSAEPLPLLPQALASRLRAAALKGGATCVVVVAPDGTVTTVDVAPRRPSGEIDHGPDRQRKVEANLDQVGRLLASLAETRPGLDVLRALDNAVRSSQSPAELVVISSGVSTVDPVDLRRLSWDFAVDSEARRLAERHAIPDLSGWRVTFVGVGDTAGTQPRLTIALRQWLGSWWTAVCKAAGAAGCVIDGELLPARAAASANDVPVVPLPAPVVSPGRVVIPGVLFALGSAAIDPSLETALEGVAAHCVATGARVLVEGHTDAVTGTPALNRRLSQARADAVAAWLVAHGVAAGRISAVGRGQSEADVGRERADPRLVAADRNVEITVLPAGAAAP